MHYLTPGVTDPRMSREPLATEGEVTPGPDDYVPYDDPEYWEDVHRASQEFDLPEFDLGRVDGVTPEPFLPPL